MIKYLSVSPIGNACPLPGQTTGPDVIEPAIRAWTTHIQNSNFAITETASPDATLSAQEVVRLRNQCYAIVLDGSGKGICLLRQRRLIPPPTRYERPTGNIRWAELFLGKNAAKLRTATRPRFSVTLFAR